MPYKDKEKQLAFHRERHLRVREYLSNLKESTPCTDCGNNFPHYIMEFDHVRGEKIKNVSAFGNVSLNDKRLQEEIAKCDIVCANCHRTRTHERGQQKRKISKYV